MNSTAQKTNYNCDCVVKNKSVCLLLFQLERESIVLIAISESAPKQTVITNRLKRLQRQSTF